MECIYLESTRGNPSIALLALLAEQAINFKKIEYFSRFDAIRQNTVY
jgi:hypothetical protein